MTPTQIKKGLQSESYRLSGHGRDIKHAAERVEMFANRIGDIPSTMWEGEIHEIEELIKYISAQTLSLKASAKFARRRFKELQAKEAA